MKTFHSPITHSEITRRGSLRLILAVIGVVTAIVCSLALLQDARNGESLNARAPRLLNISKMDSELFAAVKID